MVLPGGLSQSGVRIPLPPEILEPDFELRKNWPVFNSVSPVSGNRQSEIFWGL
jgi:hypothetical protein